MTPKRILAAILFSACLLSVHAQQSLSFVPAEWDFETILEADGPVTHTFTGVNVSDRPVVILQVYSSCGCTVPEYSRRPILPNEKVEIKVTYDPANRPGTFNKELSIYDSERNKAGVLAIRGTVIGREKTLDELYPVTAGALRLSQNLCTFSYLYHGQPAETTVGIVNPTNRTIRLELVSAESSGVLALDYPHELASGERAEIRLRYEIPQNSSRYGTIKDVLTLRMDGHDSPVQLTTHGIAVDNPELSDEILRPKAEIDKYILKFGALKPDQGLQKLPFRIVNRGDGVLVVRAVETEGGVGSTLRTGRAVAPGKSVTAYATLDPAQQEHGLVSGRITIVTNDSARPMRMLRVTAVVGE